MISIFGSGIKSIKGFTEMGLREIRRRLQKERQSAIRRFRKQKRLNSMAAPGGHDFVVVLDHLKPAFNIGKIFRSADAFDAAEVHLIATPFFDPAPAKGSFKWVPAKFHDTLVTFNAKRKRAVPGNHMTGNARFEFLDLPCLKFRSFPPASLRLPLQRFPFLRVRPRHSGPAR